MARSQGSDRFEYLPIRGYSPFYTAARDLLFGSLGLKENRTVSVHTVAGTGANSLGARFLKETISPSAVWVPDPTWVNHHNIWSLAGVEVKTYPYWDSSKRSLKFERLLQTLENEAEP